MSNLHETLAQQGQETDKLVEDNREGFQDRFLELVQNEEDRNIEIWADELAQVGLDEEWFEITIEEALVVPLEERDQEWYEGTTAIASAARKQAMVEVVLRPLIDAEDEHVRKQPKLDAATIKQVRAMKKRRNAGNSSKNA